MTNHALPQTNTGPVQVPASLLSERDAARYIGMSVHFLQQARVRGRGPAFMRIGRSVRYSWEDLQEWLDSQRVRTRTN